MDFDEVLRRRKMIREYDLDRQQIPNEVIRKLIKNAIRCIIYKKIVKGVCCCLLEFIDDLFV
jgi:hypothetical protein